MADPSPLIDATVAFDDTFMERWHRSPWVLCHAPRPEYLSLSRLWYTVPPMKGGTTYGQCTVHRCAGPPHRVPGFDQSHTRRVSAVGPALRGGVPRASRRVAPLWETPDRPPDRGVLELSSPDAGTPTVFHSHLPQDLCAPGGARAPVWHGPEQSQSVDSHPPARAAGRAAHPRRCPGPLPDRLGPAARRLGG